MKAIAALLGYFLVIFISILVMIFGWGVEPKSWAWIIGGTIASTIVMLMMHAVSSD